MLSKIINLFEDFAAILAIDVFASRFMNPQPSFSLGLETAKFTYNNGLTRR